MKTQSNFNSITDAEKRGDDWDATYQESVENTIPAEALPDDVSETDITDEHTLVDADEKRGDNWDATYEESNIESETGPDDIIQTEIDDEGRGGGTQADL